jgi:hypothetical protein
MTENNIPYVSRAFIHYRNVGIDDLDKYHNYQDIRIIYAKSKKEASEKLFQYWKNRTTTETTYTIVTYNITEPLL